MFMFELFPNRSLWLAAALSCSFIVSGPALAHDSDKGQHSKTVNCHESDKTVSFSVPFLCHESIIVPMENRQNRSMGTSMGTKFTGFCWTIQDGNERVLDKIQ